MHSIAQLYVKIKQLFWTALSKRRIREENGGLKCNFRCRSNNNTFLGRNCNFNGMKVFGSGKLIIGNNFHSGTDCQIITGFHNYDSGNAIPYDDSYITKDVRIGDNVWIGNSVIILGGSVIGDGVIIQAGSVVCGGEIPSLGIAGGHPAKVFKFRNKEHYDELVSKGKYH